MFKLITTFLPRRRAIRFKEMLKEKGSYEALSWLGKNFTEQEIQEIKKYLKPLSVGPTVPKIPA